MKLGPSRIFLIPIGAVSLVAVGSESIEPHDQTVVSGIVTYGAGQISTEIIDMSADPFCTDMQSSGTASRPSVSVGPDGGVAQAIVYVKRGAPADAQQVSNEPVMLDQEGCVYRPGVVALRTNQPLLIRNSDATLHNVHVHAEINRPFNIGQPFQGVVSRRQFTEPELGIAVRCDIHGWMSGTIAVFDHSYFSVTGEDGSFSFDLPPGNYEIEAWHPELGSRTQSVTVDDSETPRLVFEF